MPRHTLFFEPDDLSDDHLLIQGVEADHAKKSKRLRVGDEVYAIDGVGARLLCRLEGAHKKSLELVVLERETLEPPSPAVHLLTATPKGQRLDKMIDAISQTGAASWAPLDTKLGVVDPGASKLDRMRRITIEAAKQSGRSHLLQLRRKVGFAGAIGSDRAALVIADASGGHYRPTGAGAIRVLIGPEGGFVGGEIEAAVGAGAQVVSLGPNAMRIETAATVAAALVVAAERAAAT